MKVSVNCSVTYSFELNVPKMVTDLPCYVDSYDPVYFDICKTLNEKGLNFNGTINSIVDKATNEIYYKVT